MVTIETIVKLLIIYQNKKPVNHLFSYWYYKEFILQGVGAQYIIVLIYVQIISSSLCKYDTFNVFVNLRQRKQQATL